MAHEFMSTGIAGGRNRFIIRIPTPKITQKIEPRKGLSRSRLRKTKKHIAS
jgi:hypothetical protein